MTTSSYIEYIKNVHLGIEPIPITKEEKLTIYTLIGPYDLIGKYKAEFLVKKMIEAHQVIAGSRYTTDDWEYYLQDGKFNPDWLLEQFLNIWYYPTDYIVHSFGTYRIEEKYQWITVIKEEDEEAYRVVDSIHSLVAINNFLPLW